jgi:hypothetical protein
MIGPTFYFLATYTGEDRWMKIVFVLALVLVSAAGVGRWNVCNLPSFTEPTLTGTDPTLNVRNPPEPIPPKARREC